MTIHEFIDDDQIVNRNIFFPHMYCESNLEVIDRQATFVFQYCDGERAESVIWRKYAGSIEDVHKIGCEKEARDNQSRPPDSQRLYKGSMEAAVGAIRNIPSVNGYRFDLSHQPNEGIHHAHVKLVRSDEKSLKKVPKNDRIYLVDELFQIFSDLHEHSCWP